MQPLQIKRVEHCLEWLQLSAEDYTASQSIGWLIDQLGQLCKSMAFINEQMAISKRVLNERKAKAYETYITSAVANAEYFAPSLAKEYVGSKCSEDQYNYDICERCSRTITHTIDSIRTCISALKEEAKIASYVGTI